MNPLVVTTIVALATFVLSIFAANWLNQRFTEKLIEQQSLTLAARFETLRSDLKRELSEFRAELKQEIADSRAEARQNNLALRGDLKNVETRLQAIEQRLTQLENRVFKVVA